LNVANDSVPPVRVKLPPAFSWMTPSPPTVKLPPCRVKSAADVLVPVVDAITRRPFTLAVPPVCVNVPFPANPTYTRPATDSWPVPLSWYVPIDAGLVPAIGEHPIKSPLVPPPVICTVPPFWTNDPVPTSPSKTFPATVNRPPDIA